MRTRVMAPVAATLGVAVGLWAAVLAAQAPSGTKDFHPSTTNTDVAIKSAADAARAAAAVLEPQADAARSAAHRYLERYLGLPNYLNNLREAGFSHEELAKPGADRLVDSLVAWGDEADIRGRLRAFGEAGADHVALIPLTADGRMADRATMEALAPPW